MRHNIWRIALSVAPLTLVASETLAIPVAAPQLIDNSTSGYSTVAWSEQSGVVDAFNNNQGFNSVSGNAGASATYTFSGLMPGTQYRAFATWRQAGQANVSDAVPYTVSDGGGTINVNQRNVGPPADYTRQDTNGAGTLNFRYQHLTTVTESGDGVITVTINGPTTGPVASQRFALSDAVVLAPVVSDLQIIDNGDLGYSQTGFTTQASSEAFNSDQAFNSAPNNGGFATWTFDNLAAGVYEVFATWDQTGQDNLSTVAPYTLSDGGGLVTMNQELPPAVDLIAADNGNVGTDLGFFNFVKLGDVTVSDGQFVVRLDAVAGGGVNDFVFADAVAIRLARALPEPSSAVLLASLCGVTLLRRRRRTQA